MQIKELEDLIKSQIKKVIVNILSDNQHLPILVKSRGGAEISDWIQGCFIEYTKKHEYLKCPESAPKGKTKNPWDARIFFQLNDLREEIWIDFKAFKLAGNDSNPDIGTPDKIIKFIKAGLCMEDFQLYNQILHTYYKNPRSRLKINLNRV